MTCEGLEWVRLTVAGGRVVVGLCSTANHGCAPLGNAGVLTSPIGRDAAHGELDV